MHHRRGLPEQPLPLGALRRSRRAAAASASSARSIRARTPATPSPTRLRYYLPYRAAVEGQYRFFTDTWGVDRAHRGARLHAPGVEALGIRRQAALLPPDRRGLLQRPVPAPAVRELHGARQGAVDVQQLSPLGVGAELRVRRSARRRWIQKSTANVAHGPPDRSTTTISATPPSRIPPTASSPAREPLYKLERRRLATIRVHLVLELSLRVFLTAGPLAVGGLTTTTQGDSSMRNRVALSALLAGTRAGASPPAHAHAQAREEGRLLDGHPGAGGDPRLARLSPFRTACSTAPTASPWCRTSPRSRSSRGGRYGKGVLVVRDKNGSFTKPDLHQPRQAAASAGSGACSPPTSCWCSPPARASKASPDGKLTLGADASVAAGPVGRAASAATDPELRRRGVFVLARPRPVRRHCARWHLRSASTARPTRRSTTRRASWPPTSSTARSPSDDEGARRFLAAITSSTEPQRATAPAAATGTTKDGGTPAPPPASGEARTFPMEDAKPGEEPK